jgi:hypothetical protein
MSDPVNALPPIIDGDIHNVVPSVKALHPFLSDHWRETVTQSDFRGPLDDYYPAGAAISARPGSEPPDGGLPGSKLDLVRSQVLDRLNVAVGILNCAYAAEGLHNPYGVAALTSAVNDWQVAEWLEAEPRLRASIVVPSQQPELAAKEIRRVGQHPGFVQVFLPARSAIPYGNRLNFPIYEAAVEHDLVIGLHFGGAPGNPPTPSGWPSYYIETYVGMSAIFQTQVISLIVEGVFEQFPTLRVALIESGITWLPSLMWRLDKEWKGLRREIPWVKRLPSDYIREHMRLTLEPIDAPPEPAQLQQIFAQIGSDEMVMFSTDYPHWHFAGPTESLLNALEPALKQKIMVDNARKFYRL